MSEVVQGKSETGDRLALGDALNVWAFALLVSIVLGAGTGPALRGARAGLDRVIATVDRAAAITSQFAALATWLLVAHLSMVCLRVARRKPVGLFVVLGATLPIVTLMGAQRLPVGQQPVLVSLVLTGVTLLTASLDLGPSSTALRRTLVFSGLALTCRSLSFFVPDGATDWPAMLQDLGWFFGFACTLEVCWQKARISRSGTLLLPIVLFSALLASQGAKAASFSDVPFPTLLVGRTLDALLGAEQGPVGPGAEYLTCLALVVLLWTLLSRLRGQLADHAAMVSAASLALCTLLPASPMLLGAAALSALSLVVLSREEERGSVSA